MSHFGVLLVLVHTVKTLLNICLFCVVVCVCLQGMLTFVTEIDMSEDTRAKDNGLTKERERRTEMKWKNRGVILVNNLEHDLWMTTLCVCVYLVVCPDVSGENGEVVKAKRHVVVHILVQPLMSWAGVTMATHRLTKIMRQRHTSQVQGNCWAGEGFRLTFVHLSLSQTDLHVNKGCVTPSGWTTRTWWRQLVLF